LQTSKGIAIVERHRTGQHVKTTHQDDAFFKPVPLRPLSDRPLVSVLLSNYNYGSFLQEAIESVLQQTYEKYELIICDDGSTDGSRKVLESFQSLDPRITVIFQSNQGQSGALNAAFQNSRGEMICLMDADDIFRPEKLESLVDAFVSNPDAGFAIHRMVRVDKFRNPLGEIPLLSQLPSGWQGGAFNLKGPRVLSGLPPSSGLILHRTVADLVFPIPTTLRTCADTAVQILAPLMTPIISVNRILGEYRIHGGNNLGRNQFGAADVQRIMFYDNEAWNVWRNYVAVQTPSKVHSIPARHAPSMMEYAHARFARHPSYRTLYRLGINSPRYQAMSALYRCYWKMSIAMPDWLFRRSFGFVYGQSTAKIHFGRFLDRLRSMRRRYGAVFQSMKGSTHPRTASIISKSSAK
jgi:glycosyltransferase involved in cell wall biosynthesis